MDFPMAAVVAALGYQPLGSPPVEEMGDGEEALEERWHGGVGERSSRGTGRWAAVTQRDPV